jgi:hypothetical protein
MRWDVTVAAEETAAQLVDLYKVAVEMADRVSERRAGANTYFVSVQSAIIAALAFLASRQPAPPTGLLVGVCSVGVLAAGVWFVLLRSYRELNRVKFAVILELEKRLPTQMYTDEWALVKQARISAWRSRYAEFGAVERFAPILFASLDMIMIVYLVVW